MDWASIGNRFKAFFENLGTNYIDYILQIILFSCLFYYVFKILKDNKANKFIVVIVLFIVLASVTFAFSQIDSGIIIIALLMTCLLVFTMFHTEIKRSLLDSNIKKNKNENLTVSGIELIIDRSEEAHV